MHVLNGWPKAKDSSRWTQSLEEPRSHPSTAGWQVTGLLQAQGRRWTWKSSASMRWYKRKWNRVNRVVKKQA